MLGAAAILRHIAHGQGIYPRAHVPLERYGPPMQVLAAATGLFGVSGFAAARLLVPDCLLAHRPVWVLPIGACVSALALTMLGFGGVGLDVSLGIVLGLGALGAVAVLVRDHRGGPAVHRHARVDGRASSWGLYVALLVACVALIPLIRAGFPTVIGDGSDAHLAVGTAEFLQHHYPASVHPQAPINEVPPLWRSKTPIYYAFAGVASLSGLVPYQVMSALLAAVLALAIMGFFLIARELLGAGLGAGVAAAGAVGLDQLVIYPAIHPFYNQTWGLFAMPFALVLAWVCVADGGARRTPGAVGLLVLFFAVCAFAYPLAAPIPVLAMFISWLYDRRERRSRGEAVAPLSLPRGLSGHRWRVALIAIPVLALLAVPGRGVIEKLAAGARVILDPSQSLLAWWGGMSSYVPEQDFFDISSVWALAVLVPGLAVGTVVGLRWAPRPVARGLIAVIAVGAAGAVMFRLRPFGTYFHFKLLAFVGPLVVAVAVVGFSRLRPRAVGLALTAALIISAVHGAGQLLKVTSNQLPRQVIALDRLSHELPRKVSIRLDITPPLQIWVAYLLHPHPLCSQRPLLDGSYPHVVVARRADWILVNHGMRPPVDGVGPPRYVGQFLLYRARPGLPGPNYCSPRMVQSGASLGLS